MQPHRGPLLLTFGILGIVLCQLFGPVAWIMARGDLAEMDAGNMDPEGESLTHAGWVLGIVGTVILILTALLAIVFFGLFLTAAEGGEPFTYTLEPK